MLLSDLQTLAHLMMFAAALVTVVNVPILAVSAYREVALEKKRVNGGKKK